MSAPEGSKRDMGAKSLDAPYSALVIDKFAIPLTRLLQRSPITPNQLSILSLTLFVVSGVLFSFGHKKALLGFIIGEVAFLLDCVDGKLARVRGSTSPLGHFLDHHVGLIPKLVQAAGVVVAAARLAGGPIPALTALAWALTYIAATSLLLVVTPEDAETIDSPGNGRLSSWFKKHRAKPWPTPVEAERVGFIAAALPSSALATACLMLSGLFFSGVILRWYRKAWHALTKPSL